MKFATLHLSSMALAIVLCSLVPALAEISFINLDDARGQIRALRADMGGSDDKKAEEKLAEACREAVKMAPKDPVFHMQLGAAYQMLGNFMVAETEYKTAKRLAPKQYQSQVDGLIALLAEARGSVKPEAMEQKRADIERSSFDYGPYQADMQLRVKRGFSFSPEMKPFCVRAAFKADRAGKISDVRIAWPSGQPAVDEELIEAVKKAAPLKPRPDTEPEKVDLQICIDRPPVVKQVSY